MVESNPGGFFPKIGLVAEKADASENKNSTGQAKGDEDEDRPVEEVESLCMNCGEQVRDRMGFRRGFAQRFGRMGVGHHEVAINDDPLLQGGDHHVVQV